MTTSAQQTIGSPEWHIARCGEDKCPKDDSTKACAKAHCLRNDCPHGLENRLRATARYERKLLKKLFDKSANKRIRPVTVFV